MKKGLNVTLMTVAIAVMALQAMAIAPVIDPIPSPIVGNESSLPSTQATPFVYPDAFNLDNYVADETTADADIQWSYTYTGTDIYKINNVAKIVVGTDNIDAPGAKRLNGSTTDPADVDTLSKTITIRNIKYRPIGGPNVDPTAPAGIIAADTQVITFFASDGTTHNLGRTTLFYTDNGGNDRWTGTNGPSVPYPTIHPSIPTMMANWAFTTGAATSSTDGGTAVCVDSGLTGLNMAGWDSTWGVIPLTANTVYRIRAKVNGSQVTGQAPTVPFWDLIVDNYQPSPATGLNLYGGDHMFLDNEGPFVGGVPTPGANAAVNTAPSGKTFTWVWCPAPILTTAWNDTSTGPFATAVGTARNARFRFRVMDVGSASGNGGITADWDGGRLCLKDVVIESIPYANLHFTQAATGSNFSSTNLQVVPTLGTTANTATYSGGNVSVKASSAGASVEYVSIYPGNTILNASTPQSAYTSLFPLTWESNTLYQVVWNLDAPTSGDESTPWDVMYISMDTATNELIEFSFVTMNQNRSGMPKVGTAQPFMSFLYSHNDTASGVANFHRIRPRMELANAGDSIGFGTASTGAVRISGWTVNKVTID